MRWLVAAIVGLGVLVSVAPSVARPAAAAPRIIMLHDGLLGGRRVYMTDWHENLAFMGAVQESGDADAEELRDRPVIHAALFWHGPTWERFVDRPERLEKLTPDLAEQRGRIYPAWQGRPALFVFESIPAPRPRLVRLLAPAGADILRGYGIPMEE